MIRLNDLSVAVLLDRNSDGYDGGQLSTVSNCLDPNASASTAADCLGYGMCLDLNLLSRTQFETCSDDNPGLATQINAIQITDRISGMVCGGVPPADDDLLAQSAADSDPVTIDLTGNVEDSRLRSAPLVWTWEATLRVWTSTASGCLPSMHLAAGQVRSRTTWESPATFSRSRSLTRTLWVSGHRGGQIPTR